MNRERALLALCRDIKHGFVRNRPRPRSVGLLQERLGGGGEARRVVPISPSRRITTKNLSALDLERFEHPGFVFLQVLGAIQPVFDKCVVKAIDQWAPHSA